MDLSGTTTLLVGGTSGIGLAAAQLFDKYGGETILAGRSATRLHAALATIQSGRATGQVVDAMDQTSVNALFAHGLEVDHLVISVGGNAAPGLLRDLDEARWRAAFDAKFWTFVRIIQASLTHVRRSITLVTGTAARGHMAGLVGLAATNGALEGMIGTLARELAPLRINTVSTGPTDSPYWDGMDAKKRKAMLDAIAKTLPVGRVAQPRDIGGAILFLATNGFTTGTILDCDGGARYISQSLTSN